MFIFTLEVILIVAAGVLTIPVLVLFSECALALLPARRSRTGSPWPRPRVAVLMPAHNEVAVIEASLGALRPQLATVDRVLVVADNCDDATAEVAVRCGAEVCQRRDPQRRGKGFALDFGMCRLSEDPPEVVVIVDADCTVEEGTIDRIARQAAATGRPVQAMYLMRRPPQAGPRDLVSTLAFLVKNLVRPLGLARIGMPCPLTGSAMAFPWHVIRSASLASDNLVEDLRLGIDLAIAGDPAMFCAEARVTGQLPSGAPAAVTQRTRWEHGHLRTLREQLPRLIVEAVRRRRAAVLAVALDLSVPPLSLLVMAWLVVTVLELGTWVFGNPHWSAGLLLLTQGLLLATAVSMAWLKFARNSLPLGSLLAVPLYLVWKVPMYVRLFVQPQRAWIRTERQRP